MNGDNPFAPPSAPVELPQAASTNHVLASRWARLFAALIDSVIMIALLLPWYIPGLTEQVALDPWQWEAIYFAYWNITFLAVHGWLLHQRGQTIGKLLLGIQAIDLRSGGFGLYRMFVLRVLPIWVLCSIPAWLGWPSADGVERCLVLVNAVLIFGTMKRCGHDWIAGTIVVRLRAAPRA